MSNKCVSCGAELPAEGYGTLCEDCKIAAEGLSPVEAIKKRISFSYGENPGIHIHNSYLVNSRSDVITVLRYIHSLDEYKKLQEAGYTRDIVSEYREWKGHNTLYRLGLFKKRTCSVDIDQKESKFRRCIYAILSVF